MPVSQASWLPWQYPCPEVVLGRRHRLKCVSSCKTSVEIRLSMSVNMLFCPQCLHQKQSHVLLMNGLMNDLLCNSLFRSLNLCKRNVSVQQRTHCLHLRSAFVCGNVLDWIPIVCYKKKNKKSHWPWSIIKLAQCWGKNCHPGNRVINHVQCSYCSVCMG